jgi:transposase-like protein
MNPEEGRKPKTTREKKCPYCRSANVEYVGASYGRVTASERRPDITDHQFKCQDCQEHFWYGGPFP